MKEKTIKKLNKKVMILINIYLLYKIRKCLNIYFYQTLKNAAKNPRKYIK